jgi:hypothetical protein
VNFLRHFLQLLLVYPAQKASNEELISAYHTTTSRSQARSLDVVTWRARQPT